MSYNMIMHGTITPTELENIRHQSDLQANCRQFRDTEFSRIGCVRIVVLILRCCGPEALELTVLSSCLTSSWVKDAGLSRLQYT